MISDQANATSNEIITDELLVLSSTVYLQLAAVPLSFNYCLSKTGMRSPRDERSLFDLLRHTLLVFVGLWTHLAIDR